MMNVLEADVLLARGGDHAAFHRLINRCASTVSSIAFSIVRNVHASEDIAQEVFLAAWCNLRSLRNPASFLPWLRQITRNQAHAWCRGQGREATDYEAALVAAADPAPSAAERVLSEEEARIVSEVLDVVPDEAREILVLYYREEKSTRHVAQLLGIREDAVRQRLARSRALVRQEVLQRFGCSIARTTPGAAFGITLAAALTAAPTVSAAAATGSSAASGTAALIAKGTLAGAFVGWAGVLMGMRHLEPAFDDQESRELRRFRNSALAVVTIGCAAVAMRLPSVLLTLIAVQTLYVVVACMYAFWLPRILERRFDALSVVDATGAAQMRRGLIRSTVARAAGTSIFGLVLMAVLLVATR
jgi:RNA polymerase sigma factor (sigma-70 family)